MSCAAALALLCIGCQSLWEPWLAKRCDNNTPCDGRQADAGAEMAIDHVLQFGAPMPVPVGSQPVALAAADLNMDQRTDLVALNTATASVSVLLTTTGPAMFQQEQSYYTSMTAPQGLALGDVNNDGQLDILTANTGSNNVTLFLNVGLGAYNTSNTFAVGNRPLSIVIDQLTQNSDSNRDFAVVNSSSNTVGIYRGNGNTSFTFGAAPVTATQPQSIVSGEYSGDGKRDLAVTVIGLGGVRVFYGDGLGNFNSFNDFGTGMGPSPIVQADFNGDSKPDFIVGNKGSQNFSVMEGDGTGGFRMTNTEPADGTPTALASADFNLDGHQDLAVVYTSSTTVYVITIDGKGSFITRLPITLPTVVLGVIAGDFNGDGKPDLAFADTGANRVLVVLNETQ